MLWKIGNIVPVPVSPVSRKNWALEFTSAKHEYKQKGRYRIAVKVIDIFGNDTMKVVEVKV